MEGAYLLWDDLLIQLSYQLPGFTTALVRHMQARLAGPASIALETDPMREALCEWISHILTSGTWSAVSTKKPLVELQHGIMEECFVSPAYWSLVLARNLLASADKQFAEDWRPFLEAASATAEDDTASVDEVKAYEEEVDASENKDRLLAPGWSQWRGYWGRRPIGGSMSSRVIV
jgi:ribosomal biogenesis protein LAS1